MAKPRVFISSTYYDLKHIRSSLDLFIESLGFESVLSEKGNIAYVPDGSLEKSCYREVGLADIFVLLIGGRYGSESGEGKKRSDKAFYDKYNSITKKEYDAAVNEKIPTYILIESNVYSEYQTYQKNRDNLKINYAHVESVNVFVLIEEILKKPQNIPIQTFERFSEIEAWLREQWSGFFKELLDRISSQYQLETLSAQVAQLKESNVTLKRYLESLMKKVVPDSSDQLIESEDTRLEYLSQIEKLKMNPFVNYLYRDCGIEVEKIAESLEKSESVGKFFRNIKNIETSSGKISFTKLMKSEMVIQDLHDARSILGLLPYQF